VFSTILPFPGGIGAWQGGKKSPSIEATSNAFVGRSFEKREKGEGPTRTRM